MSARQIIGAAMLLALTAGLFAFTTTDVGVLNALLIWVGAVTFAAFTVLAVDLLLE